MRIRRARRYFLSLMVAAGVAAVAFTAAAPAASACGMFEGRYLSPHRTGELLLAASTAANDGRLVKARYLARQVATGYGPRAAARAEAWAIMGWVDWQQGQTRSALASFRRARAIDRRGGAIDRVLQQAPAGSNVAVAEVRKALAG